MASTRDDVLLSPDLLPVLFESLTLSDSAAAATCAAWALVWKDHLRRCRYLSPAPVTVPLDLGELYRADLLTHQRDGVCVWAVAAMPGGALCVAAGYTRTHAHAHAHAHARAPHHRTARDPASAHHRL